MLHGRGEGFFVDDRAPAPAGVRRRNGIGLHAIAAFPRVIFGGRPRRADFSQAASASTSFGP
jgi:hypothetical protein